MRAELSAAMRGLIASADPAAVYTPLSDDETAKLVRLAAFTARARPAVERDGYTGDLLVMPQPEGPARLVKALRRLYGALGALGVDTDQRWSVLTRITVDCTPSIRVPLMRYLLCAPQPQRTSAIAADVGMVTKTAHRTLDDLALIGIADRSKKTDADNSPDLWMGSDWLRDYWPVPKEVGQKTLSHPSNSIKEDFGDNQIGNGAYGTSGGFCPTLDDQAAPPVPDLLVDSALAAVMAVFSGSRIIADEVDDGLF